MATDEQKEKRREYYAANRDRINAQRRAYKTRIKLNDPERWERIKERERERSRRQYYGNQALGLLPTKAPSERRAYYAANKDRINERRRRWFSRPEVRDRHNARVRADRAANPEKYREWERQKRARRREKRTQSQSSEQRLD